MTASIELFSSQSRGFYKFLDRSKPLVYNPDAEQVRQQFDIPKRRLENVDELVKNGELDLDAAEERRLEIERLAFCAIPKYVRSSWDTSEGLAPVRAIYRSAVSGEELQPDVEEAMRRKEALRKFEDVLSEIVTRHRLPFRLDDDS